MLSRQLSRNSLFNQPIHSLNKLNFSTLKATRSHKRTVNQIYEPQNNPIPTLSPIPNQSSTSYTDIHNKHQWDDTTIHNALQQHTLMAWGATDTMLSNTVKTITGSDGVYLFDSSGKKYIDFSSQAVCTNLGHTMPEEVQDAINTQINTVPFLYGGLAISEIRARLSHLLSEICPGDINAFLFPSSGSEANEAAIRIVRKYTGKKKIMSRYRSYHGGTLGSLAMTGDSRRFDVDKDIPGFIKIFDPYPMYFKWCDNLNEDEIAEKALESLHEQILLENPLDIAGIFIEGITGANGWLKPPIKYIQGVRALCDKYEILLVCDEVMAGFGRTGKMFSFEHFEGVKPDIITFAKGLTGSFLPLSGVGVSDKIMNYFRNIPLGYGSTFQAHPVAMACAYSVIKYMCDNNILIHVNKMEKIIKNEMQLLLDNDINNCIAQARIYGMAGCIDLMNPETMDILCSTNEIHPKAIQLKKNLNKNGFISLIKGPVVHITPPLISNENDIKYGFDLLRKSLNETFEN
eukprot:98087_1